MNIRVHIASDRETEIGIRCRQWAGDNLPLGFELVPGLECGIFISVLYGKLLDKKYIDGRKCFNFHPGLLPEYRGAGAFSWAIINREAVTGITLHEIDYHIDSGPIIETRETLITEWDTAETLFHRSMDLLFDLFQLYFHRLLLGDYSTRPNEGGKLYRRRDLDEAKDLTRFVRALTFEGKESAYYYDRSGKKTYLEWWGEQCGKGEPNL